MPAPPPLPPNREEFEALLARVVALESSHLDSVERDRGQDAQIDDLRHQRDAAEAAKVAADFKAQQVAGLLKRLERLTVTAALLLGTYFVVRVNEREGDPDPVVRRWALLLGGAASTLVLTGNADVIGRSAETFLGRHGNG